MKRLDYRLDIDAELPLTTWMSTRMAVLGLSKAALARRMGYLTTVEKGVRRLDALLRGDLKIYRHVRGALAIGLGVDAGVLDAVVEDTRHVQWARIDRDYRRGFLAHVVWDTERRVPRSIAVAAIAGLQRALYFCLSSENPSDWSEQAALHCPTSLPCYGAVCGFWVNYSPDCAVYFDRLGNPISVRNEAVRPGTATACIGTRPLGSPAIMSSETKPSGT